MQMQKKLILSVVIFLYGWLTQASADTLPLPDAGDDLVGSVQTVTSGDEDMLVDIAYSHDLGFNEILIANPGISPWMPAANIPITLPKQYILPNVPREGIVVNIAEMRLYYFPAENTGQAKVETFPISIGREGWSTPEITAKVTKKVIDPVWYPPESIRIEHAEKGSPLPMKVPAGADNPLGKYALYLNVPFYLIHGTNKKFSIGMQATHGCIRLYAHDIEHLYDKVPIGTSVRIVNQPYKVGWYRGVLYIEVHPWLEGTPQEQQNNLTPLIKRIVEATRAQPNYPIDWDKVKRLAEKPTGIPAPVGAEQ